jgi:hypothetical protein
MKRTVSSSPMVPAAPPETLGLYLLAQFEIDFGSSLTV